MSNTDFRYLLDTNIISDMVRNPAGRAATALAKTGDQQVCTSIIVACELRYGLARRGSMRLTNQVETVLSGLPVLAFETPAERHYGALRAELTAMGQPIGHNDCFIAAHALTLDVVLVTDNTRDFCRVPTLRVENWLAPGAD